MKLFKKLNTKGFAHHFLLVVIILGSAIGGTYYLVYSHANGLPTTGVNLSDLSTLKSGTTQANVVGTPPRAITPTQTTSGGITVVSGVGKAYSGCSPSYSSMTGISNSTNTLYQVPCAGSGLQVIGSSVWYNGNYIGPTGVPIYTQAQWDALTPAEQAQDGSVTIIGGDGSIKPPPKKYTNGKIYAGNNNGSIPNTAGLTVQGKNRDVTYNGDTVGPSNKPLYTQAQFNKLPSSKQKELQKSGNYAIVADQYAGLAGGKSYNSSDGYSNVKYGAPVSDAQVDADYTQCNKIYGTNTAAAAGCVSNLEDSQEIAAKNGTVSTLKATDTINTVSAAQAKADQDGCNKFLGSGSEAAGACVRAAQNGQGAASAGGSGYKHVTKTVTGSGKKKVTTVVTVKVNGSGKTTVTKSVTKGSGKDASTKTTTTTLKHKNN